MAEKPKIVIREVVDEFKIKILTLKEEKARLESLTADLRADLASLRKADTKQYEVIKKQSDTIAELKNENSDNNELIENLKKEINLNKINEAGLKGKLEVYEKTFQLLVEHLPQLRIDR